MTRDEFLNEMMEILQLDELSFSDSLQDMPEWDSLAQMATIALAQYNFNKDISLEELSEIRTLEDIARLVNL